MSEDAEQLFIMVLRQFREYLDDCDADIEGCSADELKQIEELMNDVRVLRGRIITEAAARFGWKTGDTVQ